MIYRIIGNPTEPYWSIQGLHHQTQVGLKLDTVYNNSPFEYVVFLDNFDIATNDDMIMALLRRGRRLINNANNTLNQQYWFDELGKVRLCS